jgi:hypothetical protein
MQKGIKSKCSLLLTAKIKDEKILKEFEIRI